MAPLSAAVWAHAAQSALSPGDPRVPPAELAAALLDWVGEPRL